jgi:hypothetical protein
MSVSMNLRERGAYSSSVSAAELNNGTFRARMRSSDIIRREMSWEGRAEVSLQLAGI